MGERLAETAHQSGLRTPFPPTSCKCSAIHSVRHESTGSHRMRIQQTYFSPFNLSNCCEDRWEREHNAVTGEVGRGAPVPLMQRRLRNQTLPLVLRAAPPRQHKAAVPSGSIALIKRHISWSSILHTLYLQGTDVEVALLVKWINTAEETKGNYSGSSMAPPRKTVHLGRNLLSKLITAGNAMPVKTHRILTGGLVIFKPPREIILKRINNV